MLFLNDKSLIMSIFYKINNSFDTFIFEM